MWLRDNGWLGGDSVGAEDKERRGRNIRLIVLPVIFAALFATLLYRTWELQIVNGQKYVEEFELRITRTVKDSNTRGMIYDCNGEILAYNELVFTVTMVEEGDYASERERNLSLNGAIYQIAGKLDDYHERINNELKIVIGADGNYEYTVNGSALLRFKADVFGEADPLDMTQEQAGMDANTMVKFLAGNDKFALYGEGKKGYSDEELQKYGLPEEYTEEEILTIVGIRYMLSLNAFKKYVPIILARDVSEETVAYVLENNQSLTGIGIGQDWERVYTGGEAFSHILGYTGKISSEELEQYGDSDRNYTADSVIGKAGVEQYFEGQLQGMDGERQITVNNVGKMVGEDKVIKEMESGRDVYLSIDKNLQTAVYHILEQELAGILASNLIPAKEFDKTAVSDTSHIRIPIGDVYMALADNQMIRLGGYLRRFDATDFERKMAEALEEKYEKVLGLLLVQLRDGDTAYRDLTGEMKEYLSYLVNQTGMLKDDAIHKEDKVYMEWKGGGISVKEYLMYAIEKGWIEETFYEAEQKYFTAEEMYEALIDSVEKKTRDDGGFERLLFRQMILEDEITGKEVCMLLYDQGILPSWDRDYEKLMSGEMDAFAFMKKKIEQLEITPAQLALDPCSASAVVVQADTGKVLALVSYPGYDNNRLANQMEAAYYNQLLNDKSLPLYNRATQQLTAPGSTLKPITIIAGLQEGAITQDSAVVCDGVFDKVAPSLKCWKHSGHGNVENAPTALQFSCNDYMCEIAYRLGTIDEIGYQDSAALEKLQDYAELFYLGQKSGIELAESMPHITDAYGIPSAIGQGTHNYATVQLARYVNTIASKGDVYPLSLVKGITDVDGKLIEEEAVMEERIELPDSVWAAVCSGMVQFAGNNAVLKEMGIPVAGKTGTAQESETRPDHALFVGYAPAEVPEITVTVRIANGYGSSNATAVGRNIFNYYFGLEKREEIITGEAAEVWNIRTD